MIIIITKDRTDRQTTNRNSTKRSGQTGFLQERREYRTVSFHNFKSQNFKLSVSNPEKKMLLLCPYCLEFQIARV